MTFLRRLFGGSQSDAPGEPAPSVAEMQAADETYERELLRDEAERCSSDLLQRQLRYADRSWTPPAQGDGTRATPGGGDTASD